MDKKIAICFSGELRQFENEIIIDNFYKNIGFLKPDIFISGWDHISESLNHSEKLLNPFEEKKKINDIKIIEKLKNIYPNLKSVKIENYNDWLNSISHENKNIIYNSNYNPLTVNSFAQIYKICNSVNLKSFYEKENNFKYDIVIRMRTDNCIVSKFKIDEIKNNTIYNINFPNAFYPNRIYDIFFYGDSASMDILSRSYINYINLLNDNFYNGLCKRDACRILYLQCLKNNINVDSCDTRYTDIYRQNSFEVYFEYIKQHRLNR